MNKITDIFGYISSKQMNLEYIEKFNLIYDFKIMFKTVFAVAKNNA